MKLARTSQRAAATMCRLLPSVLIAALAAVIPTTPAGAGQPAMLPTYPKPMPTLPSASLHWTPPADTAHPADPHPAPVAATTALPSGPDPSTLPAPPGVTRAPAGAELPDRRTPTGSTYATDTPGRFITRISSTPVHYQDANGRWQNIDSSLAAAGADGYRHAKANAFDVAYAPRGNAAQLARVGIDATHSIAYSLEGAQPVSAVAEDSSVTYPQIMSNVDVRMTSRPDGSKEDLVLDSPTAPTSFVFPLELRGLTARVDDSGGVVYEDDRGTVRARTPAGVMEDANIDPHTGHGARSRQVTYSLVATHGGIALRIDLDTAFLTDPATRFPVTVDPTLSPQPQADFDDTYAEAGYHNTTTYWTDSELPVGAYDSTHVDRSFLHFNLSPVNGMTINRGTLYLWENASWSCQARPMNVVRVTSNWLGYAGETNWPAGPVITDFATPPSPQLGNVIWTGSFAKGYAGCAADYVQLDTTDAVRNWTSGAWANQGIALIAPNETDVYSRKEFNSENAGVHVPLYDIDYNNPPPGVPTNLLPSNGTVFSQSPTQTSAVYSDPDGEPGYVYFRVRNSAGASVSEGYSSTTAPGATATRALPALAAGTYTLDAFSADNSGTSAWTAPQTFTVGAPPLVNKTLLTTAAANGVYSRGQQLVYAITVTNQQPQPMSITGVSDVLPTGMVATGNGCSTPVAACTVSGRNVQVGAFTLPAAPATATVTVRAVVAGDDTTCSTWNNVASATNGAGTGYSNTVPVTVCDTRLGLENWWSYVSRPLGPQGTASVNVSNGNLVVTQTDSTPVQGHGHVDYVIRRAYNSADSTALDYPTAGSIGAGWQLNVAQGDDIVGAGASAVALGVPSGQTVAEAITQPLAVTLIDRDGTHHVFQPNALTAALPVAAGATGALAAQVIHAAAGTSLCIDQTYTAPPGVHLGLWRYIQVTPTNPGGCTPQVGTTPAVLGFAAERPDRVRYEFAPTGELVDLLDGAGVDLRYAYDSALPAVPLGKMRAVFESRGCASPTGAGCRSIRLRYSADAASPCPAGSGEATVCVDDPAGRITIYHLDTQTPARLVAVTNPDGVTLNYSYGNECGGQSTQLCSASDPRGDTVRIAYTAAAGQAQPAGSMPVVSSVTDRAGATTVFSDTASTATADTDGRRSRFAAIDSAGRVGETEDGDTSSNWVHQTFLSWDTGCRSPDGAMDNNLCRQVRKSLSANTPDEDTQYTYSAEGDLLDTHQAVASSISRDVTNGYHVQYVNGDGTIGCLNHTPTGSGAISQGAGGCNARPGTSTLFAVTDRTATLPARGNDPANAASYTNYLTTYQPDVPSSSTSPYPMPNTPPTGVVCQGAATNTGLSCETDTPASAGVPAPAAGRCTNPNHAATYACTRATYDTYGQKISDANPTTNTNGGGTTCPGVTATATYCYTYYTDADTDLSGGTSTGGWLKGVTDAAGHFVAFAYDRAGNQVRAWDRNATTRAGLGLAAYPGTIATPPSGDYTETLYATGSGTTAYANPWRWERSQRDQLGNLTTYTVDGDGNRTTVRPPRGTAAATTSYDTTQTFDAADNLTSQLLPAETSANAPWRFSYDKFNQRISQTDPLGHVTVWRYDNTGRVIATRWSRGTNVAAAPTGCPPVTGDPDFPDGTNVCSTTATYDGVDNQIAGQDGNHITTARSFDAAHRPLDTITARNDDGLTTIQSATVYDLDDHPTDVCPPREFTEGTGNCTTNAAFSRHDTIDPAGHRSSSTTYRSASQPVTARFGYDANNNPTALTDPNGYQTTTDFDLLDRRTAQHVPRDATHTNTTTWSYDASGNVATVVAPPGDDGAVRQTAYSYDAANRPVDTVTGADNPSAALAGLPSTDGGSNIRTRVTYDPDSNITARYSPRAFSPYGTHILHDDLLANPNPAFAQRTDYNSDDQPSTIYQPRYDTLTAAPITATAQSRQCPTGATNYPADVGVCITRYEYDVADRRTGVQLPTVIDSANRHISYTYTDDNLIDSVVAPSPEADGLRVRAHSYAYDADGRTVRDADPLGHATLTSYTDDGLTKAVTGEPNGNTTHITTYHYDANGNRKTLTNAKGETTNTSYTNDNLINDITDPLSNKTSYGYDPDGNTTTITSPAANFSLTHPATPDPTNPAGLPATNTFTYDNLLKTSTVPVNAPKTGVPTTRTVAYTYDPAGRRTAQHTTLTNPQPGVDNDADAGTQHLAYYPNDRLRTQSGRNSETITTTYDPAGNPSSLTDSTNTAANLTATYYLDDLPRTVDDTSRTASYAYDGLGNRISRADTIDNTPIAHTTQYAYNDAELPASETADLTGTTPWSFSYDRAGRPLTSTNPNGTAANYSWNPDDTLQRKTLTHAATTLADWAYTYDELYRITKQTLSNAQAAAGGTVTVGGDYTYAYYPDGRLSDFTDTTSGPRHISYDHDGNRTSYDTANFTYRADDAIATAPGPTGPVTFTYAAFGGVKTDDCAGYAYDGFDRVTTITPTPNCTRDHATRIAYTYDGLDRQHSNTDTIGGTDYRTDLHYDGLQAQVTDETGPGPAATPEAGRTETLNVLDATGSAVANGSTNPLATAQYLDSDGHGNITTITDSTGAVACNARFDPYGNPEAVGAADDAALPTVQHTCNSGTTRNDTFYRGDRHDTSTGNYQLGSRTYDPAKAGFLTPDTYRAGDSALNLSVVVDPLTRSSYTYVNGDPVNQYDPNGHMPRWAKRALGHLRKAAVAAGKGVIGAISGSIEGAKREAEAAFDSLTAPMQIASGMAQDPGAPPLAVALGVSDQAASEVDQVVGGAVRSGKTAIRLTTPLLEVPHLVQRARKIGTERALDEAITEYAGLGTSIALALATHRLGSLGGAEDVAVGAPSDLPPATMEVPPLEGVGAPASAAEGITNPVPESLEFAKVIKPDQIAQLQAGGNPLLSTFRGASDAFITSSEALPSGLTRAELASRLTIPEENVGAILRFRLADIDGLASPINRDIPGFVGRGLTAGGLPEFVIPNQPVTKFPWWDLEFPE